MRRLILLFLFVYPGVFFAQAGAQAFGPGSVWNPPGDFIAKAHAACEQSDPSGIGQCFINEMANAGAPVDAVAFTRALYDESDGQVGILLATEKAGPVDMARVLYPLRANDNYGLLLLNGDPSILDVDNLKKLDRAGLDQNSFFQAIKQKYPDTELWPGDRSGSQWPRAVAVPGGGEQIIVSYSLQNGCRACAHVGLARFAWNFDASGKFLGTKYVNTPPPPKITQPHHGPPVNPPPPQQ